MAWGDDWKVAETTPTMQVRALPANVNVVRTDNKPPLPAEWDMSFATPNEHLKYQAAEWADMSDQARRMLYDTPIEVRPYHEGDSESGSYNRMDDVAHRHLPRWASQYFHKPILVRTGTGYPPAETLAHEAGHQWYFTQMPRETRNEFQLNYRQMPGYEQWRDTYGADHIRKNQLIDTAVSGLGGGKAPTEIYATALMKGGENIHPEWRNKYFSGFFDNDKLQRRPNPWANAANTFDPVSDPPHWTDEMTLTGGKGYLDTWGGEQGPVVSWQKEMQREHDTGQAQVFKVPRLAPLPSFAPVIRPGELWREEEVGGEQGPKMQWQHDDEQAWQQTMNDSGDWLFPRLDRPGTPDSSWRYSR